MESESPASAGGFSPSSRSLASKLLSPSSCAMRTVRPAAHASASLLGYETALWSSRPEMRTSMPRVPPSGRALRVGWREADRVADVETSGGGDRAREGDLRGASRESSPLDPRLAVGGRRGADDEVGARAPACEPGVRRQLAGGALDALGAADLVEDGRVEAVGVVGRHDRVDVRVVPGDEAAHGGAHRLAEREAGGDEGDAEDDGDPGGDEPTALGAQRGEGELEHRDHAPSCRMAAMTESSVGESTSSTSRPSASSTTRSA